MSFGAKAMIATSAAFLAAAYGWIFRARKVAAPGHEVETPNDDKAKVVSNGRRPMVTSNSD